MTSKSTCQERYPPSASGSEHTRYVQRAFFVVSLFILCRYKNLHSLLFLKIPDGKPPNVFGLNEKFMDKHYAREIIKECNHAWKDLITGEKERNLEKCDQEVKGLVRKLSKSNLVDLAINDDDDEAPNF